MIFEKIAGLLSEQFGVEADSITMDTSFEDLGADSLDIVELTMAVEEEFGLENMDEDDLSGVATVADLVRYLKSKLEDLHRIRLGSPAAGGAPVMKGRDGHGSLGRKAGLPLQPAGPVGKRSDPQLLRQ